jgi:hypothetical protein
MNSNPGRGFYETAAAGSLLEVIRVVVMMSVNDPLSREQNRPEFSPGCSPGGLITFQYGTRPFQCKDGQSVKRGRSPERQ